MSSIEGDKISSVSTHVYNNLSGGAWLPASTNKTFLNTNPADTNDLIGEFQESGADDVDAYNLWRLNPRIQAPRCFTAAQANLMAENTLESSPSDSKEQGRRHTKPLTQTSDVPAIHLPLSR